MAAAKAETERAGGGAGGGGGGGGGRSASAGRVCGLRAALRAPLRVRPGDDAPVDCTRAGFQRAGHLDRTAPQAETKGNSFSF